MSDQQMTPWFVNGEAPWEPGVYNVSCLRINQSGEWWCKFDGKRWANNWCWNKDRAAGEQFMSGRKPGSWRGLAHPPKAKP